MRDPAELATAGRAALDAYQSQPTWLHRIVETLTFRSPDELLVRRDISFDLTIPPGLRPTRHDAATPTVYVPLSLVPKWPPLIGLDLRNSAGDTLPFLTREQNGHIDYGLLTHAAERILHLAPLPPRLGAQIEEIARSPGPVERDDDDRRQRTQRREESPAERAYYAVIPDTGKAAVAADAESELDLRMGLAQDPGFRSLARNLVSNTVLWMPVDGYPGERRIVKVGYDIRREFSLYLWRRASYGWTSFNADFDLPHIGTAGSYHLDIETPAPLRVIAARLQLDKPSKTIEDLPAYRPYPALPGAKQAVAHALKLTIDERAAERHGTFYVGGHRECEATAWIKVLVEKHGYIRGACLASCVTTAVLISAYAVDFGQVVSHSSGAVTVLIFLPALLSYIVVRTGEHALAKQFLSGLRKLVTINSLIPLAGAVGLMLNRSCPTPALRGLWWTLMIASGTLSLLLAASAYLPWRQIKRPPLLRWMRIHVIGRDTRKT